MLLFVEPPKYGRSAAGTSSAITIHQPAPAITPPSAASSCQSHRRTAANCSRTDSTPSIACGASSDHELNPKIRADISSAHRDAGVLSTVMKLEESKEPKKNAFHDRVPACTAAA